MKKILVAAAIAAVAVTGSGPATAGDCLPIGTTVGSTSATVCVAVDTPTPGYPSTGLYVAPHGYLQVCTPSCTTLPFSIGPTGAAIVPPVVDLYPGYQVVILPGAVIVKVSGIDFRYGPAPLCIEPSGTC